MARVDGSALFFIPGAQARRAKFIDVSVSERTVLGSKFGHYEILFLEVLSHVHAG
jgi:hypothetical protein